MPSGPSPFDLTGRVAVVTGGSRGIGRAIALGLARAGADVVVSSRNEASCAEVAREVADLGRRALAVGCDVTQPGEVDALFDRVADELGGCRLLVSCAGLAASGTALAASRDELSSMMAVHYLGGVQAAQRAALQMREHGGGAILLVTSVWGLGAASRTLAYGAAKAALAHAVKVLAVEWARDRIRVNGLAPGLVETDMTAVIEEPVRDMMVKRIPMRRVAAPSEMAGPALFLLSDAASYVTGHTLVADGGERAR